MKNLSNLGLGLQEEGDLLRVSTLSEGFKLVNVRVRVSGRAGLRRIRARVSEEGTFQGWARVSRKIGSSKKRRSLRTSVDTYHIDRVFKQRELALPE